MVWKYWDDVNTSISNRVYHTVKQGSSRRASSTKHDLGTFLQVPLLIQVSGSRDIQNKDSNRAHMYERCHY